MTPMRTNYHLFYALPYVILLSVPDQALHAQTPSYPWTDNPDTANCIATRIAAPEGFSRVPARPGSFGDWLRHLPLKAHRPRVLLYNGAEKTNQEAHFAVLDIDTGNENLQQCADAVIRLVGEYLYSTTQVNKIAFNFTNGDTASFAKWIKGYRPIISGANSQWVKSEAADSSYANFRKYLDCVFMYAGTLSLSRELIRVSDPRDIRIGDVWIKGGIPGSGNPGHAVIVLDVAIDSATGERVFILAQSYMPAQDIHVLNNPNDPDLSPWYRLPQTGILHTPEWDFKIEELSRMR
jgi:hypothetical protein